MNDRVLRVIVADDHPVFRQGLRASLSAENDIEVVAECGDGPTVVANATTARPDVVLMGHPYAGDERHRSHPSHHQRCAGHAHTDADDVRRRRIGVRSDEGRRPWLPVERLRTSRHRPRCPLSGRGHADSFGPAIAGRMMALFARRTARPFPVLTEREHAVLEMIAEGRNNPAIAPRAGAERQDSPKLRLDDLQQAPGCRSRRGDAQGACRRPGAESSLVAAGWPTRASELIGRRHRPTFSCLTHRNRNAGSKNRERVRSSCGVSRSLGRSTVHPSGTWQVSRPCGGGRSAASPTRRQCRANVVSHGCYAGAVFRQRPGRVDAATDT